MSRPHHSHHSVHHGLLRPHHHHTSCSEGESCVKLSPVEVWELLGFSALLIAGAMLIAWVASKVPPR